MLTRVIVTLALSLFSGHVHAQSIELGLPLDCTLGKTCWVQQYFDHDPSTATRDYACGEATYDGHDGTDIRIQDTGDEAAVLASAPGIVRGVRNDMADHLVRGKEDEAAIKNRECGNGVVIDHENGWQTQYCHMRKGSVLIKKGDRVDRGTRLGFVGYSGLAAFPHVHLSVRKGKEEVDPFNPESSESCGAADSLWNSTVLGQLKYTKGDIIGSGFASRALKLTDVEGGEIADEAPSRDWPVLVFYGWAINLNAGDTLTVSMTGPENLAVENKEVLDRHKAQYFLFAGKKKPAGGWPPGQYNAEFTVTNTDGVRLQTTKTAVID